MWNVWGGKKKKQTPGNLQEKQLPAKRHLVRPVLPWEVWPLLRRGGKPSVCGPMAHRNTVQPSRIETKHTGQGGTGFGASLNENEAISLIHGRGLSSVPVCDRLMRCHSFGLLLFSRLTAKLAIVYRLKLFP